MLDFTYWHWWCTWHPSTECKHVSDAYTIWDRISQSTSNCLKYINTSMCGAFVVGLGMTNLWHGVTRFVSYAVEHVLNFSSNISWSCLSSETSHTELLVYYGKWLKYCSIRHHTRIITKKESQNLIQRDKCLITKGTITLWHNNILTTSIMIGSAESKSKQPSEYQTVPHVGCPEEKYVLFEWNTSRY